jgi:hypothetical protein
MSIKPPSHLSEPIFRRYEPLIAEGIKNYPTPTQFRPGPDVAITTFVARFRDAITSFRRFKWSTILIDTEKFHANDAGFVVRHDNVNDCAIFDKRQAAGRGPTGVKVPDDCAKMDSPAVQTTGILHDLSPEELTAFCLLLSNQRLEGPIIIGQKFDQELINSLLMNYNVGIQFDVPSNSTILL